MSRLSLVALVAALGLAACCRVAPPAEVVPIISAYTAVLLIADSADDALGRTACDLNDNPVIYLHRGMTRVRMEAVLLHERIHAAQMRVYAGGCSDAMQRYDVDSAFRLRVEAEAFCGVYEIQTRLGGVADPSLDAIVRILMQRDFYKAAWSAEAVRRAMRCWAPPPDVFDFRVSKPPR